MCDYRSKIKRKYKCPHPNYGPGKDGEGIFCIFHSDNADKDVEKFYKKFEKLHQSGRHDFRGFVFPEMFDFRMLREEMGQLKFLDADFTEAVFLCDVDLSGAEFYGEGETNFSLAKFAGKGSTSFNRAKFTSNGGTDFRGTQFACEGGASFRGAQFGGEGETIFSFAKFSVGANFSGAEFSGWGGTTFNRTQFTGKGGTYFIRARFHGVGVTDFSRTQFTGDEGAYFSGADFSSEGGTHFIRARFSGEGRTVFSGARFSGRGVTDFSGAKFTGKRGTSLSRSVFSSDGWTSFRRAEFSGKGEVSFSRAEFTGAGGIYFNRAKFSNNDGINFRFASFSSTGGTYFRNARFLHCGRADFRDTKFYGSGEVKFEGRTFYDGVKTYFSEASFENPEKVSFNYVDLNRCRFIWTDLKRINFKEVFWTNEKYKEKRLKTKGSKKEKKGKLISTKTSKIPVFKGRGRLLNAVSKKIKRRIMVYDETYQRGFRKKKGEEEHHYAVQQLYNQLRLNYEAYGRFYEAGDFFVGAMEMRRKGRRERWMIRKLLLPAYKLISFYGERPIRAFLWIVILLAVANFFTLIVGIEPLQPGFGKINLDTISLTTLFTREFLSDYLKALYVTLNTLTLGAVKSLYTINHSLWGLLLNTTEVVFGAVFFTLFILAMNRKFRRTKD